MIITKHFHFMGFNVVKTLLVSLVLLLTCRASGQAISDNFEGNGNITNWFGDDCVIDASHSNPFENGMNSSATVLAYRDQGGQFANVRFQTKDKLDLSRNAVFSFKIYIASNSITGSQTNQVSLKLQDGTLPSPWTNQSEIIKPLVLDQWQEVQFDFSTDNYINLDPNSLPPTQRKDFNRVLIQINGEDNNDRVTGYIDDFTYQGDLLISSMFNRLVWSDEFEEDGAIDGTKWFHQTQLPTPGGWYNNEIQHYTDRIDNAMVKDGILSIIAKRENYSDQGVTKNFTSARLNSKFAFQYGRVEVRAKLPSGIGTWPAIWTLGKNINEDGAYWDNEGFGTTPWPACGEIDIMEHWGNNQNFVQSATHTPSSHGATENHGGQVIPTASSDFHVYAVEWTANNLVFSVDDVVHYTYNPPVQDPNTWPFDAEQYLLLNVAIQPSIEGNFTQSAMEIDYVRVYQEGETVSTIKVSDDSSITFYPNPIEDEVNIILPMASSQNLIFDLYHSNGKLVKRFNQVPAKDSVQIQGLGGLQQGLYILVFRLNGQEYRLKMIKDK